jgi:hypothetical protein
MNRLHANIDTEIKINIQQDIINNFEYELCLGPSFEEELQNEVDEIEIEELLVSGSKYTFGQSTKVEEVFTEANKAILTSHIEQQAEKLSKTFYVCEQRFLDIAKNVKTGDEILYGNNNEMYKIWSCFNELEKKETIQIIKTQQKTLHQLDITRELLTNLEVQNNKSGISLNKLKYIGLEFIHLATDLNMTKKQIMAVEFGPKRNELVNDLKKLKRLRALATQLPNKAYSRMTKAEYKEDFETRKAAALNSSKLYSKLENILSNYNLKKTGF